MLPLKKTFQFVRSAAVRHADAVAALGRKVPAEPAVVPVVPVAAAAAAAAADAAAGVPAVPAVPVAADGTDPPS